MVNANFTGKVGILTMALFDRKSRLGATLAAAATAGLVAAPTLAQSQDQMPAQMTQTATTNITDVRVPMRDARGVDVGALRLGVAGMSANMNQIVVYYGEDSQVFESIREGARGVIAEGELPLRGIVIASPKEEQRSGQYLISSQHQLEVWSDGQITSTIDNPDTQTGAQLSEILAEDMDQVRALAARGPSQDRG